MKRLMRLISQRGMKALVLVAALVLLLCSAAGGTFAYIVVKTPVLENIFVGKLEPVGSLTVSKTIEHPFGEGYEVPDNQNTTFSFAVDLGKENAGKSFGSHTASSTGVITLDVKAQSAVVIPGIPAGTQAVVSEVQNQKHAGFSAKDGQRSQTVTITEGNTASAAFVNVYAPDSARLNLAVVGSKELVGRDWQEGDSFTYRFERLVGNTWAPLGEKTITCHLVEQANQGNLRRAALAPDPDSISFDFSELMQKQRFDTLGTHSFRVTQVETNIDGLTHESTEERFDVHADDSDMDGKIEVRGMQAVTSSTKIDEDQNTAIMLFRSMYAPESSSSVSIDIVKHLNDKSGQGRDASGFVFELYDENDTVMQTSSPTDALGHTSLTLTFGASETGKTFAYTLREKNDSAPGISYDSSLHVIEVTVEEVQDETLRALVSVDEGEPADSCTVSFTNTYDPTHASTTIAGSKELTGRALKAGEFQFNLYQTTSEFEVPESAHPLLTTSNDLDGAFAFDALSFDAVGTYYYVVLEDASEPVEGVEYDHSTYAVTVSVADEGGRLVANQAVRSMDNGKSCAVAFSNAYKAEPVDPGDPGNPEPGGQDDPPNANGGDGGGDGGDNDTDEEPTDKGALAQTGDDVYVLPIIVLAVAAAAIARRLRKSR